jgi:uncharacterized protein YkwD
MAARAGAEELTAEVLRRVNAERAAAGLKPLARAPELDLAALRHTEDMARGNFLGHTGSDGSDPVARLRAAGYVPLAWGENVAAGFTSAESVVAAWMKSPGHRANILGNRFTEIGIAVLYRPGTRYGTFWAQVFGARVADPAAAASSGQAANPAVIPAEHTERLLGLINEQRRAAGLAPLSRPRELDEAARRHATDMAARGFFGHFGSDGTTAGERVRAAGYDWRTCSENIAAGFPTPEAVLSSWLASPDHRANLLAPEIRDVGLARVADERSPWGIYWTATFAVRAEAR